MHMSGLSPYVFLSVSVSLPVIILGPSQHGGFKAVGLLRRCLSSPRASISRDLGISYRASYGLTLEIETIILPLIGQKQVAVSAHPQVN